MNGWAMYAVLLMAAGYATYIATELLARWRRSRLHGPPMLAERELRNLLNRHPGRFEGDPR